MRPLTHDDLTAAARVLLAHPRGRWGRVMAGLLATAEAADAHRRCRGQAHPHAGDGTLAAAALMRAPAPAPPVDDDRYLAALGAAVAGIRAFRRRGRSSSSECG